ncbi:MAG: acid phosphatase [Gemmatimonadaceae bacterium]
MPSPRSITASIPLSLTLATLLVACSPDRAAAPIAPPRVSPADAIAVDAPERDSDPDDAATDGGGLARLRHVVVVYLENRSFDNLYGEFPGADGLSSLARSQRQVDASGVAYTTLPQVAGSFIPTNLPNAPFDIAAYVPPSVPTIDLVHRFYQEQAQINGGRMDRFALVSDAKGLVMGYYPAAGLPLVEEARRYTLCDRFFHAAYGGSFLNHMWLIAAASPRYPGGSAPPALTVTSMAPDGTVVDGQVTSDGYLVNTVYSVNSPHPSNVAASKLIPDLRFPTIGDRLSERGVSWGWYAGGWNDAVAGRPDPSFQFHHHPFAYFANYADGTPGRARHLKDEDDFVADVRAGRLPAVSFVKPLGINNEHPGYTDLLTGERHVKQLVDLIRSSKHWKHTAIIITYDENGGFWDHVAPPMSDRWGSGTRVPTLVISPFARAGVVDHHEYDTTSILALIERRWNLRPLGSRDAAADPLSGAFDFGSGAQENAGVQ